MLAILGIMPFTSTPKISSYESRSLQQSSSTRALSARSTSSSAEAAAAQCVDPLAESHNLVVGGSCSRRKRAHLVSGGPRRKKMKTAEVLSGDRTHVAGSESPPRRHSSSRPKLLRDKVLRSSVSPMKEVRLKLSRRTADRKKQYYGEGSQVETWFEIGRLRRAIAKGCCPKSAAYIHRFLRLRLKRLAKARDRQLSVPVDDTFFREPSPSVAVEDQPLSATDGVPAPPVATEGPALPVAVGDLLLSATNGVAALPVARRPPPSVAVGDEPLSATDGVPALPVATKGVLALPDIRPWCQLEEFLKAADRLEVVTKSYKRCKRRLIKKWKDLGDNPFEPNNDMYQRMINTKVASVRRILDFGVNVQIKFYEGGGCRVFWPFQASPSFHPNVKTAARLAVRNHLQKWDDCWTAAQQQLRESKGKSVAEVKAAKTEVRRVQAMKVEEFATAMHEGALVLLNQKVLAWGATPPVLFSRRIDRSYDIEAPGASVMGFFQSLPQPVGDIYREAYQIILSRLKSFKCLAERIALAKVSVLKTQKNILMNLSNFYKRKDHPEYRAKGLEIQKKRNARRKETSKKNSGKIRMSNHRINSLIVKSLLCRK